MQIMYKSHFNGWVEVTEEQKNKLVKHLQKNTPAIKMENKEEYINSRFKYINEPEPTKEIKEEIYVNNEVAGTKIVINNINDLNNINIQDNQTYLLFWYDTELEKQCTNSYKGKYINKLINDFLQDDFIQNIKIANMYDYYNQNSSCVS